MIDGNSLALEDIFSIIQGHQITDEEIYNSLGRYPIYTGPNKIKGFWDKTIITSKELPCLTYATKGFDGTVTLQEKLFDANNTAVLILKKEIKELLKQENFNEKIFLQWFEYMLPKEFFKIIRSEEGVSYLNKEIVSKIEIELPTFDKLRKQVIKYEELKSKLKKVEIIIAKLEKILEKDLNIEYDKFQIKNINVSQCFGKVKGSSELTEEKNYLRQNFNDEKFVFLTGGIENLGKKYVYLSKDIKVERFLNKEGLLVVRKGKAGKTIFLTPGKYVINDNAYIIYVLDSCKYKINLNWFSKAYKKEIFSFASNSDNGTWNMTGFFKELKINIPLIEEQERILKYYLKIEEKLRKLLIIESKIKDLLNKKLI